MDGKSARLFVEDLIRGTSRPDIVTKKRTYDMLNAGAEEFVSLTECIKKSEDLTTVADQAAYDLSADYLRLWLKTDDPRGGDYFVRYTDSSSVIHEILWRSYQKVFYDYNTTSVSLPSYFTILEKTSLPDQLTGTTTATGTQSGGAATLTDAGESFETYISARDRVHNTTSGKDYSGIVISVTSDTALVTAMFDTNGDPQGWASGDTWVIQPTARMQLQLDPPPETASETVTVPYVAKPNPVYSDYYTWQIQDVYHKAFCFYAAYLYLTEYQVQESVQSGDVLLADKYFNEFNRIVHRAKRDIDLSLSKQGYSLRMNK